MYVVTVVFDIIPEHAEKFREAILRNAAASLRDEEGCYRFDVCFSEDGGRCFLYELYTNRQAFEEHRQMAHFKEFNRIAEGAVTSKQLETFVLADNVYIEAKDQK